MQPWHGAGGALGPTAPGLGLGATPCCLAAAGQGSGWETCPGAPAAWSPAHRAQRDTRYLPPYPPSPFPLADCLA